MTLDISRVLDDGHYQRTVAFAKKIGLYAPKKPEPHPDTHRYWYRKDPHSLLKVLEPPTPEGRACFIAIHAAEYVTPAPFWLSVADLHAGYEPAHNHTWDSECGSLRYLRNALAYLDGYAESRDDGSQRYGNTRTRVYADISPASFAFYVERWVSDGNYLLPRLRPWFEGGLVYHGPTDGWGDGADVSTFAFTLEPTHGWSIHT